MHDTTRHKLVPCCNFAGCVLPQNLDARTRTVKVRPPKTKYFVLREFFKPTSLAGGLETRFEVSEPHGDGSPPCCTTAPAHASRMHGVRLKFCSAGTVEMRLGPRHAVLRVYPTTYNFLTPRV